jgi:hypothetical protein
MLHLVLAVVAGTAGAAEITGHALPDLKTLDILAYLGDSAGGFVAEDAGLIICLGRYETEPAFQVLRVRAAETAVGYLDLNLVRPRFRVRVIFHVDIADASHNGCFHGFLLVIFGSLKT